MNMKTILAVLLGQAVNKISRIFKIGAGATWPGEVALFVDPSLIGKLISKNSKVILVAGTNGKTTTSKMIVSLLGKSVIHNDSGANLLNGIASVLVKNYFKKPPEYYVFEVDENYLIETLKQVQGDTPRVQHDTDCHPDEGQDLRHDHITVVLLNLFRDQLDRYGETDKIAKNWMNLEGWSNLIVNGDDPQLAFIGQKMEGNVYFFGLNNKNLFLEKMQHATDSIYCPNCGDKLKFSGIYFSHLGEYKCGKCGFAHPKTNMTYKTNRKYKLEGIYNIYNYLAAELTAEVLGIKKTVIDFEPAFGRGEEINGTKILLSKNPAGFNESLRTVINSQKKGPLLLSLNDRIPDGRDISWIWDVDFEMLKQVQHDIFVSGDRALDLGLRLKYAEVPFEIKHQINVFWILATYSAMLDIRKELIGRKIL